LKERHFELVEKYRVLMPERHSELVEESRVLTPDSNYREHARFLDKLEMAFLIMTFLLLYPHTQLAA